jgi:hypothetical protein
MFGGYVGRLSVALTSLRKDFYSNCGTVKGVEIQEYGHVTGSRGHLGDFESSELPLRRTIVEIGIATTMSNRRLESGEPPFRGERS